MKFYRQTPTKHARILMALKHASKRLEDANVGKIVIFDEEKKALQCKHDCFEYYKKLPRGSKRKKCWSN